MHSPCAQDLVDELLQVSVLDVLLRPWRVCLLRDLLPEADHGGVPAARITCSTRIVLKAFQCRYFMNPTVAASRRRQNLRSMDHLKAETRVEAASQNMMESM